VEYQIKIYETSTGKRPFDTWLNDLTNLKAQIAVDMRIERVKMGNLGRSESVGEGVYELKIDFGPGYRVYFGKIGLRIILLLCAGDKQSQKKDIIKDKGKKIFSRL